jgi:hypothetical protein
MITLSGSPAFLALDGLQEVTGLAEVSSHAIVAEIGPTLEPFWSSAALSFSRRGEPTGLATHWCLRCGKMHTRQVVDIETQ